MKKEIFILRLNIKYSVVLIGSLIFANSLFANETNKPHFRYVLITDGKLNIRSEPEKGKILFQLEKGVKVRIPDGDKREPWLKIETQDKKIGYASSEFLSKTEPSKMKDALLLGLVTSRENQESGFRSFAISLENKWFPADELEAETSYLEKQFISNKKSSAVYTFGQHAGVFTPTKKSKGGCQDYPILTGSLHITRKLPGGSQTFFSLYGKEMNPTSSAREFTPDEKSISALEAQAQKTLESLAGQKGKLHKEPFHLIHSGGNVFISARYSLRGEYDEKAYLYYLYEWKNESLGKLIYKSSGKLSEDQAPYGGQFFFTDILNLPGMASPILIFFHNGFDGYLYEFMKFDGKNLSPMFYTAGDGC